MDVYLHSSYQIPILPHCIVVSRPVSQKKISRGLRWFISKSENLRVNGLLRKSTKVDKKLILILKNIVLYYKI